MDDQQRHDAAGAPDDQTRPIPTEPSPDEAVGATRPFDRPDPFGPAPGTTDPFGLPAVPPLEDWSASTRPDPQPYGGSGWGVAAPDTLGEQRPPGRGGPRAGSLLAVGLALALVAGGVGGAVGYYAADRNDSSLTSSSTTLGAVPSGSSDRPDDSIAGIAARVTPTVVSIEVSSGRGGGSGSGFVIESGGYVLTNNHVVASSEGDPRIRVTYADGSSDRAQVVGRDTSYDLAVLKVDRTGLPVATLGNSDEAVVGDAVVAVGSPLGLQGTVTTGIVSAKDRPVTTGNRGATESFISAIQTDAAINPGNSGGPLVDGSGAVIGVNSAIATLGTSVGGQVGSIGLGFAIPINQARRVAEEIIQTGRSTHPVIGASVDTRYEGPGARIAQDGGANGSPVTEGGPADLAGIEPGDVVLKVDGRAVDGAAELIVAIRAKAPGETITLTLQDSDGERDVEVTLGSDSAD